MLNDKEIEEIKELAMPRVRIENERQTEREKDMITLIRENVNKLVW